MRMRSETLPVAPRTDCGLGRMSDSEDFLDAKSIEEKQRKSKGRQFSDFVVKVRFSKMQKGNA